MEDLSCKINEEIKKSFLYKDYLFYKQKIECNEEIQAISEEMKKIKNIVCKEKDDRLLDKYYDLEKKYKSYPLVKEYLRSKEELSMLMKDIADILSLN